MKTFIYILLAFFSVSTCSAQTRLSPGRINAKHGTFIINKHDKRSFETHTKIVIYSESNKYNNGLPRPRTHNAIPINPKDIHENIDDVKPIVYGILNKKLDALKQAHEEMYILINFKTTGEVADIVFSLNENTVVTLEEIEEIDLKLRANIKVTFTGKVYLQHEATAGKLIPEIIF